MPEYVYSIILVVVIVVIMVWWVSKKKGEIWKGTFEKKNYVSGDEDSSDSYYIVFKTDEGKKKRFTTRDMGYYNSWNVGDRCEKRKGDFFPVKV
ncbi:MAG TPA: hypothetical protein PKI16_00090 [Candidatus Dojkabacteria bacterium]|nr:hypothetical protein [Candidatus Dojkabacteria bacterium]